MGRRDFRWREAKKPKKGAKKIKTVSEIVPQVQVEVVKKGKKKEPGAEG
jgi:hypothetical protein